MNIGVFGDSWAWDWRFSNRTEQDPSEFCAALSEQNHTVTNYCKPATSLHSASVILNHHHTQHDVCIVFATCAYRNCQHSSTTLMGDHWITEWCSEQYHNTLSSFASFTPQQHRQWYVQQQTDWQHSLPHNVFILGGAGPIQQLHKPGIAHVKAHLCDTDYYDHNYHSQCLGWAKQVINTDWNHHTVSWLSDQVAHIEGGPVGDPYHLTTLELQQLAQLTHTALINNDSTNK